MNPLQARIPNKRSYAWLLLLCALLLPVVASAQGGAEGLKVNAAELDKAAYAFADRYTTQMVAATDAILRDNKSPEQRRQAHLVKLVSVSGVYDIVTTAEPFAKLMDLLMVVTLQSYRWIDEDMAEKSFGTRSGPLIQAMRNLRVDIWNVAGRVFRPEQLQQLDALILDWRKRNPHVDILSYLRFDEVAGQRGPNALEEIKATGLFPEIAEATKVADDARLLAERAFYQAKRMPFLMTWQMQALLNEVLVKPELTQSLVTAETIAKSVDRSSRLAERIPDHVTGEREAIVKLLEDRNGRLAKLFGEVRSTTAAADVLAARVHKVSESGERLTLNLRDTANGFTETSNAVNALLAKHSGPPKTDAKPFDIAPYVTASIELNQTVAGLNTLLSAADALMVKKAWAEPVRQMEAMLGAQIDRAFWRALLLIVVFFALLAAYRFVSLRWARPA
ncbi:MAG: hypothetical protein FJY56_10445 [Betaproteobacteria bacterium]|nr:hypothetical protein [Betaproteobacteria bacterium]